ncbi:hypothetical protein ACFX15_027343 [Malus domestica]
MPLLHGHRALHPRTNPRHVPTTLHCGPHFALYTIFDFLFTEVRILFLDIRKSIIQCPRVGLGATRLILGLAEEEGPQTGTRATGIKGKSCPWDTVSGRGPGRQGPWKWSQHDPESGGSRNFQCFGGCGSLPSHLHGVVLILLLISYGLLGPSDCSKLPVVQGWCYCN